MKHRWSFLFFFFFLILRKLCNAPFGSIGVDDTEITFHSSFANSCPFHFLAQKPVSLIRMSSQNTNSHHLLGKRSWMAFRVEHSKRQKVSISQVLLTKIPLMDPVTGGRRRKQRPWRRLPSCPESLAQRPWRRLPSCPESLVQRPWRRLPSCPESLAQCLIPSPSS